MDLACISRQEHLVYAMTNLVEQAQHARLTQALDPDRDLIESRVGIDMKVKS